MCDRRRSRPSRGRAAVPSTVVRTRSWRRIRAARDVFVFFTLLARLPGLAGLAPHALTEVADALALVRLRLPHAADVRRDLPDELLVDAADVQARRAFDLQFDPLRRRNLDRMRIPDRQRHLRSSLLHAISDPLELERLRISVGNAGHHVCQQGSRESVQCPHLLFFVLTRDQHAPIVERERDALREVAHQLALRPLHAHVRPFDVDLNTLRYWNWQLSYSRHRPTTRSTGLRRRCS